MLELISKTRKGVTTSNIKLDVIKPLWASWMGDCDKEPTMYLRKIMDTLFGYGCGEKTVELLSIDNPTATLRDIIPEKYKELYPFLFTTSNLEYTVTSLVIVMSGFLNIRACDEDAEMSFVSKLERLSNAKGWKPDVAYKTMYDHGLIGYIKLRLFDAGITDGVIS